MSPNRMAIKIDPTKAAVQPGGTPTPPADIERINVGDTAQREWTVTAALVDAFADFSSDDNPLHMSDAFARELGFPSRVAHGMVALSSLSRLIGTELPGPGSLWISQEVHFAAPVLIGNTILSRVTVQSVSKSARVVVLHTEAICQETGMLVLRGTAKIRIPEQTA